MSKEYIEILEKYANFNEVIDTRKLQQAVQNMLNESKANKKRMEELEEEKKIYRKQLNDAFDRGFIHKDKIKEIVDECIPVGKNIITGEEEYQPNANANSYLTQTILELLKDGGE